MKNLSNQELIYEVCSTFGFTTFIDDYKEAEAELLRRLEHGDRAIKACKEIAAMEIPE